jgi:hypothetical protein
MVRSALALCLFVASAAAFQVCHQAPYSRIVPSPTRLAPPPLARSPSVRSGLPTSVAMGLWSLRESFLLGTRSTSSAVSSLLLLKVDEASYV